MASHLILLAALVWAFAQPDDTLYFHGAGDRDWRLVEMNGAPFHGEAGIAFPARNRIVGEGPCNRFSTANRLAYPRFEAAPIAATRRACPDLAREHRVFEALRLADLSVVEGDTLTLSGENGETLLVFKAGG